MRAELYWITGIPEGRLAIMPRPRAGDWLVDELASLKSAGLDVVVSLLTADEVAELGLHHEPSLCQELGLSFISCPMNDRSVPDSIDSVLTLVNRLHSDLRNGRGVAVHCRMGIGRSSLLAACLLVKSGSSVTAAFSSISRDRGFDVPDTQEQVAWVQSVSGRLRDMIG